MFHIKVEDTEIAFSFKHFRGTNFEIRKHKAVTDVTYCSILVNNVEFTGLAACADGDTFNKEIGRKVALTRALKEAKLNKSTRTEVWNMYFNRYRSSSYDVAPAL